MKSFGAVGECMGRVDTPTPRRETPNSDAQTLVGEGKPQNLTASGAHAREGADFHLTAKTPCRSPQAL
jgi:hypothetical protein